MKERTQSRFEKNRAKKQLGINLQRFFWCFYVAAHLTTKMTWLFLRMEDVAFSKTTNGVVVSDPKICGSFFSLETRSYLYKTTHTIRTVVDCWNNWGFFLPFFTLFAQETLQSISLCEASHSTVLFVETQQRIQLVSFRSVYLWKKPLRSIRNNQRRIQLLQLQNTRMCWCVERQNSDCQCGRNTHRAWNKDSYIQLSHQGKGIKKDVLIHRFSWKWQQKVFVRNQGKSRSPGNGEFMQVCLQGWALVCFDSRCNCCDA